jgi:hypothetical protein
VLTDWNWISDEERVYPVVIDPTRNFYPNPTTYDGYIRWREDTGNYQRYGGFWTQVGWERITGKDWTRRSFFYFDISTIPDSATITNVDFSFNVYSVLVANIDINSLEGEVLQIDQNLFSDIGDGTTFVSNDNAFFSTGWKTRDLGTSADSDLQAELALDNSWGVGMKRTSESGTYDYGEIWTSEIQPFSPSISVTYTLPVVISRVVFNPTGLPENNEVVRIYNKDDARGAINIDNWEIGDNDTNSYTITSALPDIPDAATLYIHFTTGVDDLVFAGDNEAHIYIGAATWFDDEGDQCYLKDDEDLYVDFVAWDSDGSLTSDQQFDDDEAWRAGIWDNGDYVDTFNPASGYEYIFRTDSDTDTDQPVDWEVAYIPEFSEMIPPIAFVVLLFFVVGKRKLRKRKRSLY